MEKRRKETLKGAPRGAQVCGVFSRGPKKGNQWPAVLRDGDSTSTGLQRFSFWPAIANIGQNNPVNSSGYRVLNVSRHIRPLIHHEIARLSWSGQIPIVPARDCPA